VGDLLLTDCTEVVTPVRPNGSPELVVLHDVSIYIREGRIVGIGSRDEIRNRFGELTGIPVYDAKGKTVLPGLVDAHTHLPFSGWREGEFNRRLHGETYMDVARSGGGINSTVRAVRVATLEELTRSCLEGLDAFVAHGVTTVEAKSGYGLNLVDEIKQLEAIRDAGSRHSVTLVPTLLAAHEYPPEYKEDRKGYVRLVIDTILPEVARRGLALYQDVFCEAGVFTVEESREILLAGKALGMTPRIHADEIETTGGAELAADVGAVSADHLAVPSMEGIRRMAEAGVIAILLPGTSFFLRHTKHAPARAMLDAGVHVALSTDFNPGSSPTTNLPLIMRLGCFLLDMTVEEVIHAVTEVPARSLGFSEDRGVVEEGKRGDLSVWNVDNHLKIFYRYGEARVEGTVIEGDIVYHADL